MTNEEIIKYITQGGCQKCRMWELSAMQNGYSHGMCEECFNKSFVSVNTNQKLNSECK